MMQRRLSQPPMTPPAWSSMSSLSGIDISSSAVHGLFTWPEMLNSFVPVFLGLPKEANQVPPLLQMLGATATVSTLVTVVGREGRLEARLALLALQRLDEGRLLAADVGAGAAVDEDVKVVAGPAGVLSEETLCVRLLNGHLQVRRLVVEFATHVDVGRARAHRSAGDEASLNQLVRVVPHDLPVLARAGLTLVGVDHEVLWPPVVRLVHEAPLEPRRKPGAAPAPQPCP